MTVRLLNRRATADTVASATLDTVASATLGTVASATVGLVLSVVAVAVLGAACATDASTPVESAGVDGGAPAEHGLSDSTLERVLGSTVGIDGVACGRLSSGSGFALAEDLIVTNAHVIVGIDELRVHTLDGRTLPAVAVAFDPHADLAILDVAGADLAPLALSGSAPAGSTGVVVGWDAGPMPDPAPYRVERAVTVRIEAVGSEERVERSAWLVAADIDPGDSGAALVDRTGEVIGVAFATSTAGTGAGYAVRSTAIESLMANGLDPNTTVPSC